MNCKHVGALNSLLSFVYYDGLKSQLGGGKLSDNNKTTLLLTIKEAMEWIEDSSNGQTASTGDLEERLAEIQLIVSPIMSNLYYAGGFGSPEDEDEPYYGHDEL